MTQEEVKQLREKIAVLAQTMAKSLHASKMEKEVFFIGFFFAFCFQAWKVSWLVSAVGQGSKFSLPLIF